ncbi:MAG: CDP-diacylglycerol--serine O-phosphatidyltransferase, partial [Hyphomicrobiaceae bacterium]
STIPTFSGKLLGERIGREWVLPIFVAVAAMVACLLTYPYATLTVVTLVYLAFIPVSYRRYRHLLATTPAEPTHATHPSGVHVSDMPAAGDTKH